MNLISIGVLMAAAGSGWWLSGFDSGLEGESWRGDFGRRFARVLVSEVLILGMLLAPPIVLAFAIFLGCLWAGCISEMISRVFRRLLDPGFHDGRVSNLKMAGYYRDTLAQLIHQGMHAEAIRMCQALKESGGLDEATINNTLEFLGVKIRSDKIISPFNEAVRLRLAGKYSEAERLLKDILIKNPADEGAAILLLRIYAEDRHQPGMAHDQLHEFEKQGRISPPHLEFARRSIGEWSRAKIAGRGNGDAPKVESLEELLARKAFGSAAELLERQIRERPAEFDLRLKLAEIHADHCGGIVRAEKILRQAAVDITLTEPQASVVATKLKEWRDARLLRK